MKLLAGHRDHSPALSLRMSAIAHSMSGATCGDGGAYRSRSLLSALERQEGETDQRKAETALLLWNRVERTRSFAGVRGYRKEARAALIIRLLNLISGQPFTFRTLAMIGGNRMEPRSTRRAIRHSLIVDVEIVDLKSGIQIREPTKDLNLYGCGMSTATPFPTGTKVMLKMAYGPEKIIVFGKVIYGRPDIGMGIVFTTVEPEDRKSIEEWIADLAIPQ